MLWMIDAHDLVLRFGKSVALTMVDSENEKTAIKIVSDMLGVEKVPMGFTLSGFAFTSLPHKALSDPHFRREGNGITLLVEAGRDRDGNSLGVPYGSIARLMLFDIQTQAVRNQSHEVELGESMHSWMRRLSLPSGGNTNKVVAKQFLRLAAARLTFIVSNKNGVEARHNGAFVPDVFSSSHYSSDDIEKKIWQKTVKIDEPYCYSLINHALPLRLDAIKHLRGGSLAVDVYTWLSYRLHVLERPQLVRWSKIYDQFNLGFRFRRQLKPTFLNALNLACAAYPGAKVEVNEDGLTLHQSLPPSCHAKAKPVAGDTMIPTWPPQRPYAFNWPDPEQGSMGYEGIVTSEALGFGGPGSALAFAGLRRLGLVVQDQR